jgi:hypothetical protein
MIDREMLALRRSHMVRFFNPTAAILSAVIVSTLASSELRAQGTPVPADPQFKSCENSASTDCRGKPQSWSPSNFNAGVATPSAEGDRLRVQGDPKAVRVDARQTTIADVLGGLAAAFNIRYRSSIALNDVRNGTYSGPLRQVISRVLDGYNYVIKYEDSKLNIIVVGKVGEQATAAPQTAAAPQASTAPQAADAAQAARPTKRRLGPANN